MGTTFKQSKKVGVAGSFFNQMMGNNSTQPVVGKGATMLHYSDRDPWEVISVSEDGLSCVIEEYKTKHDPSKPGQMGDQNWILDGLSGRRQTLIWKEKKGCWEEVFEVVEFTKELEKWVEENRAAWNKETENIPNKYYDENHKLRELPGLTKRKKKYGKISIIFGKAEKYYDWSF